MRALLAAPVLAASLTIAGPALAADLPSILTTEEVKEVGPSGRVVVASVVCPRGSTAAACRLKAPRTVAVRLKGKRYTVRISAPSPKAGRSGDVTAKVPSALRRRLSGRVATISFVLTVGKNRKAIAQKVTA